MRVVVGGSRYQTDEKMVFDVLDHLHAKTPITLLVHGACKGTDLLCEAWAMKRGIPTVAYEPDWDRWGRSAGPRRNSEMLQSEKPDLVIAFPGGRGTADLVKRATSMQLPIARVGKE